MRGAKLWLFVFWIGVGLSQSASRTGAPTKTRLSHRPLLLTTLSQPKTQHISLTHSNQIYQKERAQEGQTHFFFFFFFKIDQEEKKVKNLKKIF